MTHRERKQALRILHNELRARKDELLVALANETNRSELECFTTEYVPSLAAISWLGRNGEAIHSPIKRSSGFPFYFGRQRVIEERVPLGEILVIGTWNYPLQISFRQILSSLYAGNSVAFKPSPYAERTSELIYQIFEANPYFRKRITLLGSDPTHLEPVWERIAGVVFTGSTRVGKEIARRAAERFLPAIIEASGNDSIILGNGLVSGHELEHIVWALTTHSGETCVAPKIIWVPNARRKDFVDSLTRAITEYVSHEPSVGFTTPNTGPAIEQYKQAALNLGGSIIYEVSDRILITAIPTSTALKELCSKIYSQKGVPFAPVMCLVGYDRIAEAATWTSGQYAGLSTTTFSLTEAERREVERHCATSILSHGELLVAAGMPAVALGGMGMSGIGRSGGLEYLHQVTRTRSTITMGIGARRSLPRWAAFNGNDAIAYKLLQWMKQKA